MPLSLAEVLARLTRDGYPGVWQQERVVVPARSDVRIPHIMGRVPDVAEIGDPPLLDELQGPSVEDESDVPWSKWFNNSDLETEALPAVLVRPTGHPLVEVIEKTSTYVTVRNWFEINQDVGILIMVRQPRVRIRTDDVVAMFGVWLDFMGDDLDIPAGGTVNFTDLTTYTDSLPPTGSTWDWDWGDGSPHGNTQNPSHLYAAPGSFDVILTITFPDGSVRSLTKAGYVTVT